MNDYNVLYGLKGLPIKHMNTLNTLVNVHLPHSENVGVEFQGYLGVLDSQHCLLHNEVTALFGRIFAVVPVVGDRYLGNIFTRSHFKIRFLANCKMSLKQSKSEDHAAKSLDTGIIRYSRVWEDHKVLSEALNIQPTDVVLSITR